MPALASAAGDVFTSDGSTLTEFQGSAYGASVPSTGTVMAVDDGHAYTHEVAKYATLGGLHREWAHNNFPSVSGVAAAPDGSVYVTGTFYGSFDADPGAAGQFGNSHRHCLTPYRGTEAIADSLWKTTHPKPHRFTGW